MSLPGGVEVALQLWDIGGQSIGGKMITNYIYGAHAVVLCYDITNQESFQDLEDWYRLVNKSFATLPTVALTRKDSGSLDEAESPSAATSAPSFLSSSSSSLSSSAAAAPSLLPSPTPGRPLVVLLSNKSDLEHLRAVRLKSSRLFASENSFLPLSLSAKTGDGVGLAFHQVAAALAGVPLPKADAEAIGGVVKATITKHKQPDEDVAKGEVPEYKKGKQACNIS